MDPSVPKKHTWTLEVFAQSLSDSTMEGSWREGWKRIHHSQKNQQPLQDRMTPHDELYQECFQTKKLLNINTTDIEIGQ